MVLVFEEKTEEEDFMGISGEIRGVLLDEEGVWGRGGGRHEAQAPSHLVKNYKQSKH